MAIRLEVLPEEYALGYQGRLMRINGIETSGFSVESFNQWPDYTGMPLINLSVIEFLAQIADMDGTQFLREHTLVPLRRAFVTLSSDNEGEKRDSRVASKTIQLRRTRPNAFLCTKCIEEDFECIGITYWRREHQLPGRYCCPSHGLPLGSVKAHDAFRKPPSTFHQNHHVPNPHWVKKLNASEPIQRFLAINTAVLTRSRRLNHVVLSSILEAQSRKFGLNTGHGSDKDGLLSEYVKKIFDPKWLAEVLPRHKGLRPGYLWPPVDRALGPESARVRWAVYAILFAVLFESVDEAIDLIFASSVSAPVNLQASESVGFTVWQLRDAYLQCIHR